VLTIVPRQDRQQCIIGNLKTRRARLLAQSGFREIGQTRRGNLPDTRVVDGQDRTRQIQVIEHIGTEATNRRAIRAFQSSRMCQASNREWRCAKYRAVCRLAASARRWT
jgi:hypothetical protein